MRSSNIPRPQSGVGVTAGLEGARSHGVQRRPGSPSTSGPRQGKTHRLGYSGIPRLTPQANAITAHGDWVLLLVMALVGKCGGSEGKAAGNFDVNGGFFLLFQLLPSTWQVAVRIKSRMFGAIRVILVVLCCKWAFYGAPGVEIYNINNISVRTTTVQTSPSSIPICPKLSYNRLFPNIEISIFLALLLEPP